MSNRYPSFFRLRAVIRPLSLAVLDSKLARAVPNRAREANVEGYEDGWKPSVV